MNEPMNINWYPGHMKKTKEFLKAKALELLKNKRNVDNYKKNLKKERWI